MSNDSTNHECEQKFVNAFILRKYDIKFCFMLIDLIDASLSTLHDIDEIATAIDEIVFQVFQLPYQFFATRFSVCLKPSCRDNYHKTIHPRMQQYGKVST